MLWRPPLGPTAETTAARRKGLDVDWLITGGCGFIGRNLVAALHAEGGHRIRVYDNLSVGRQSDLAQVAPVVRCTPDGAAEAATTPGEVLLIEADILDEDNLRAAAAGVDVLVHLAANTGVAPSVENPRMDCVTNVLGVLNALEAARAQARRGSSSLPRARPGRLHSADSRRTGAASCFALRGQQVGRRRILFSLLP